MEVYKKVKSNQENCEVESKSVFGEIKSKEIDVENKGRCDLMCHRC